MKFLHTADWQIGMRAAHVGGGRAARPRRAARRPAPAVVAGRRPRRRVSCWWPATRSRTTPIDRVLVQKVADVLAAFAGPVYIIPGNHDPLVPGSVWEHPAWRSHANLQVLDKAEPIEIPGGMLYPCPLFEKHSRRDPTAWIHGRRDRDDRDRPCPRHGRGRPAGPARFPHRPGRRRPRGPGLPRLGPLALDGDRTTAGWPTRARTRRPSSASATAATCCWWKSPPGASRREITPIRTGGLAGSTLDEPIRAGAIWLGCARDRDNRRRRADALGSSLAGVLMRPSRRNLRGSRNSPRARLLFTGSTPRDLLPPRTTTAG